MTEVRLPFVLSVAAHAAGVGLLVWLGTHLPPLRLHRPAVPTAVQVIFAPPPPAPPAEEPKPPPPPVPEVKPPPPVAAEKPPPPPKLEPKPEPRPIHKPTPPPRREPRTRIQRYIPPPPRTEPRPVPEPDRPVAPPQPAPRPPAAATVTPGYRMALARWFESHKRYPYAARERGEEGQAVLRFRVERSGRILGYKIVKSTGHPDLDAEVERMMQGAALPPFPSEMTAPVIEVAVAVRFSLAR